MADAKAAQTPLPTSYKTEPFDGTATTALRSQYQSVIGSLLYLMLGTRPDLAFAVTQWLSLLTIHLRITSIKPNTLCAIFVVRASMLWSLMDKAMEGFTPIVTHHMEMTEQIQIADANQRRVASLP